jgi:hypothetical protein
MRLFSANHGHPVLLTVLILLAAVSARAEFVVEIIPADQWGEPDEAIGLAGGVVENFENLALAPGLLLEIADAAGQFTGEGSTSLLNTFNPENDDPYGSAFVLGVWDGSRCLINTENNEVLNYGSQDWRAVAFYVPQGTTWFAFASQQVTVNHMLYVNGQSLGQLESLGFDLSAGRNGVLVVRSYDPATPIVSVSFGGRGDAFTIDHVVYATPGSVAARATTWASLKSLFR